MTNKSLKFAVAAAITAGSVLISSSMYADDMAQTAARQQTAVTEGLGKTSLATLQRGSLANQSDVANALVEKLRPVSTHQSSNVNGTLHLTGEQWSLDVSSDGSAAAFRDLKVEASAHALGKPLSQKMSATVLEQKGRAFIAANLSKQIVLGKGEELVALRADYRSEGGQDLTTGVTTSAVVASRIVFGRMINGVPVVGNGSKVYVTFTNDGSVESFRYDWPSYESGIVQPVVTATEVLSRVQKVVVVRAGDTSLGVVALPKQGTPAFPLALTNNTQLQGFECGYYDAGLSKTGKANAVQPGCTYMAVGRDSNGMRSGYAGAVPAAVSFASNSAWLETQILSAK